MKHTFLSLKSIVQSRSEVASQLAEPGDAVLITRGQPRWLILKCPCGCDDEIPLNLDWRAGKAWRIYKHKEEKVTIFPSVWRDTGCFSHFIIRNGRILLMDEEERYSLRSHTNQDIPLLAGRVEQKWSHDGWVHYLEVADELGEIPWDVLDACWYLVASGFLVQGWGLRRSHFQRRQSKYHSKPRISLSKD